MLIEGIERDNMVGYKDKIVLQNKLNVGKCMIFECKNSKLTLLDHKQ
jgi:hypothetical protein